MKLEKTHKEKARFFALYLGQSVMVYRSLTSDGPIVLDIIDHEDLLFAHYLLLRPISMLTADEAADIALILDVEYSAYHEGAHFDLPGFIEFVEALFTEEPGCYIDSYKANIIVEFVDYLRSKSFAIPYHNLSINDLLEYGWLKLIEHEEGI